MAFDARGWRRGGRFACTNLVQSNLTPLHHPLAPRQGVSLGAGRKGASLGAKKENLLVDFYPDRQLQFGNAFYLRGYLSAVKMFSTVEGDVSYRLPNRVAAKQLYRSVCCV